jgi:hypothetical protein
MHTALEIIGGLFVAFIVVGYLATTYQAWRNPNRRDVES